MRVLFAGGGTGGHIYPALTIAKALLEKHPDSEVLFVGSMRGLEGELIPREGFRLERLELQAFQRRLSLDTARTAWKAWRGFLKAASVIRGFRPDVVVGTGGYVCGPVVLMAAMLGRPTLIQEQNALPGWTNRVLGSVVKLVSVGYEEATRFFPAHKVRVTGNPVRPEILQARREDGCRRFGLDPARTTVLIFGASQGARAINTAVVAAYPELKHRENLQILFVTGQRGFEDTAKRLAEHGLAEAGPGHLRSGNLHVFSYMHDMPAALAASDLSVSRAGAMSLAEMCARGVPMVLVPLPTAAENHQEKNARALAARGAAEVILERELTPGALLATLDRLVGSRDRLQAMSRSALAAGKPRAVWDIVDHIAKLAGK